MGNKRQKSLRRNMERLRVKIKGAESAKGENIMHEGENEM